MSEGKLPPQHRREQDTIPWPTQDVAEARPALGFEELLDMLKQRARAPSRYTVHGEIARGGMGAILRAHDRELDRELAMKVILAQSPGAAEGDTREASADEVRRFLDEAQITGGLDHPGIVPVHELGIDDNGGVFFTMRLVHGRDLHTIFELAREQREGWSQTRALGVLLKACEAVAYAHSKGVIHRDLKPRNIMVGRFGEVYVMDWGLAKAMDRGAPHDVRPNLDDRGPTSSDKESDSKRPLLTMDGAVIGTPAYMSPEQARGDLDQIGPRSDVYSMGAVLYELLVGSAPYVSSHEHASPGEIVLAIRRGSPEPLEKLCSDAPVELVAICEKAMSAPPEDRYANVLELAEDLRAHLEGRVVQAHRTGPLVELRKWMRRNKAFAAAAGTAFVALAIGTLSFFRAETALDEFSMLANVVNLRTARQHEAQLYPAWPQNIDAMQTWLDNDWRKLADSLPRLRKTVTELESRAEPWTEARRQKAIDEHPQQPTLRLLRRELAVTRSARAASETGAQPAAVVPDESMRSKSGEELNEIAWDLVDPDRSNFGKEALGIALARLALTKVDASLPSDRAAIQDTLAWALFATGQDTAALTASRDALAAAAPGERAEYRTLLKRLQKAIAERRGEPGAAAIARLAEEIRDLEIEISRRRNWTFAAKPDSFLHDALSQAVEDIESFERREVASVRERLKWAGKVDKLSIGDHRARWSEARDAIAKANGRTASTRYANARIDLLPQTGLVPIGANPKTKLWEFYHLRSASSPSELPTHREDGSIAVTGKTGIVFVLIPGGSFTMGAQRQDPDAANYDEDAIEGEFPHSVTLAPFFLARHELTRGQWKRLSNGGEPSWYPVGKNQEEPACPVGYAHPVEQVSWQASGLLLRKHGLALPSEAQWEYGCRAGTSTPWSTGNTAASLAGHANLLDRTGERAEPGWGHGEAFEDGFISIAPVGSFAANPFGLFDMHGNVWEWCRERYGSYTLPVTPGDGVRQVPTDDSRSPVPRGGAFLSPAADARSAFRGRDTAVIRSFATGVRAARSVQ